MKWDFGKAGVVNESDLEVVQTKGFGWWFEGFLIWIPTWGNPYLTFASFAKKPPTRNGFGEVVLVSEVFFVWNKLSTHKEIIQKICYQGIQLAWVRSLFLFKHFVCKKDSPKKRQDMKMVSKPLNLFGWLGHKVINISAFLCVSIWEMCQKPRTKNHVRQLKKRWKMLFRHRWWVFQRVTPQGCKWWWLFTLVIVCYSCVI